MAKILGHVGSNTPNIVVTYTPVRTSAGFSKVLSDASGNHSSSALPSGTYVVTATSPGLVFNSVSVVIDGVNDQVVNLRSRLPNASNSSQGGF